MKGIGVAYLCLTCVPPDPIYLSHFPFPAMEEFIQCTTPREGSPGSLLWGLGVSGTE